MRTLWLLRHAKSSWDDPAVADHERPLAPRGRKAAKRMRRWASEHRVQPEIVLCSSAVRARATLDLVLPALRSPQVEVESRLREVQGGSQGYRCVGGALRSRPVAVGRR